MGPVHTWPLGFSWAGVGFEARNLVFPGAPSVACLATPTNAARQLEVLGLNEDAPGLDGALVGVLEPYQAGLSSLGCALAAAGWLCRRGAFAWVESQAACKFLAVSTEFGCNEVQSRSPKSLNRASLHITEQSCPDWIVERPHCT